MPPSDANSSFSFGPAFSRTAGSWFGIVLAFALAALFLVLGAVGTFETLTGGNGEYDPTGNAIAILFVVGIGALFAFLARRSLRSLRRNNGTVVVADGFLLVEVAAYFAGPLAIPLQSVRVVAVDAAGPHGFDAQTGGGAIPVQRQVAPQSPGAAAQTMTVSYLQQSRYESGRVFQPTRFVDWPNVVIVFEQSLVVNIDTRSGFAERKIHQTYALPALGLRAKDPTAAARVLAATGKLRDLYEVDIAHLSAQAYGEAMQMVDPRMQMQPTPYHQAPPPPPPPYYPAATG